MNILKYTEKGGFIHCGNDYEIDIGTDSWLEEKPYECIRSYQNHEDEFPYIKIFEKFSHQDEKLPNFILQFNTIHTSEIVVIDDVLDLYSIILKYIKLFK